MAIYTNHLVITKTCLFKCIEYFTPQNKKIQVKNSDIFHISAQNIDCRYSLEPPRRGGSNEYPQSMFLSRNKKNNVYSCKPQFYYIKVGFKGVKIIQAYFRDVRKWIHINAKYCLLMKSTNKKIADSILFELEDRHKMSRNFLIKK